MAKVLSKKSVETIYTIELTAGELGYVVSALGKSVPISVIDNARDNRFPCCSWEDGYKVFCDLKESLPRREGDE